MHFKNNFEMSNEVFFVKTVVHNFFVKAGSDKYV